MRFKQISQNIKQALFDYLYTIGILTTTTLLSALMLVFAIAFAPFFIVSFYYVNKIGEESIDIKKVLEIV